MVKFTLKKVEYIPEILEDRVLYYSEEYKTVIHLCPCGCENKVVTPIGKDWWELVEEDNEITLSPSIGNFQFPCKSHYFLKKNEIIYC